MITAAAIKLISFSGVFKSRRIENVSFYRENVRFGAQNLKNLSFVSTEYFDEFYGIFLRILLFKLSMNLGGLSVTAVTVKPLVHV